MRKAIILTLSLIIVLVGISVINKKLHFSSKINKLTGEVAGIFLASKFLDNLIPDTISAQISSPYQDVQGNVIVSGQVGIGTTSPTAPLQISGNSTSKINLLITNTNATVKTAEISLSSGGTNGWALTTDYNRNGGDNFVIWGGGAGAARLFINSSGYVGIGTGNPQKPLHVNAGMSNAFIVENGWANTNSAITLLDSLANRSIIYGGPALGTLYFYWKDETGNKYVSTLSGTSLSSIKYKSDVANMEDTSWIYKLRPVNFTYTQHKQPRTKQYGLIAEEVEKVNPLFVLHDPDSSVVGVDYPSFITPIMNETINHQKKINSLLGIVDIVNKIGHFVQIETQKLIVNRVDILERLNTISQKVEAQQKQIDELKTENASLKSQLEALESRLKALEAKVQ